MKIFRNENIFLNIKKYVLPSVNICSKTKILSNTYTLMQTIYKNSSYIYLKSCHS